MPVTYGNYLKIDQLLDLQQPLSDGPEHDEMLFIVIHQVYELWFKQVLHEIDRLQPALEGGDLPTVQAGFKRVLTILKVLVAQVDILETMTPVSFNSFRSRLEAASGFQSLQFRELEFALGYRLTGMIRHHADTPGRLAAGGAAAPTLALRLVSEISRRMSGIPSPRTSWSAPRPSRPGGRTRPGPAGADLPRGSRPRERSVNASSTSMRAFRSGATATSRWSSGPSG